RSSSAIRNTRCGPKIAIRCRSRNRQPNNQPTALTVSRSAKPLTSLRSRGVCMARTILTITSDLFDDTSQEASIRENLPIRTLLVECRKEFSLPDGNYILTVKSTGKMLDPEKTLEQAGV